MMSLILAKTIPDQVRPSVYCFSGTHQWDAFVLICYSIFLDQNLDTVGNDI